ncbi:MAG: cell division protein FtsZ [Thermoleophilaceae bacterium]
MREGPLAALFRRTDGDEAGAHAASAGDRTAPTPPPAERELAHAEARPAVPPHERLRQVFSPDIPENILDRPISPAIRVPEAPREAVLRVVGVGGAGVNAVDRMIEAGVEGIEFIALNTDVQSLGRSDAHMRLHIGEDMTRGLGAGADPEIGRQACLAEYDRLKGMLKGSDMVFIAAGEGGGTGTGAAPVVARIAREVGALTVAIVTKPFSFEGSRRSAQADLGIDMLAAEVDTLIVVPNARLLTALEKRTSMVEAFRVADDVLRQGVQGISDLITLPGLINLDFADVRTVMSDAGQALLGIGMGTGEHRATEAAERAVASPLLETSVDGARSILLSITAGRDFSLWEVNEAARAVAEAAHPEANIIFGAMVDEEVDDQVWVTVVATGFGDAPSPRRDSGRDREPALTGAGMGSGSSAVGRASRTAPSRDRIEEIDVPEFIPRS